jgi:hypothetical protein
MLVMSLREERRNPRTSPALLRHSPYARILRPPNSRHGTRAGRHPTCIPQRTRTSPNTEPRRKHQRNDRNGRG